MESNTLGRVVLFILSSLSWFYFILPRALKSFLEAGLAWALKVGGVRANVILENIQIAYPGNDSSVRTYRSHLFRLAYVHLGCLFLETLLLLGPIEKHVRKKGELRGKEHWEFAKTKGKGVIFLASHVGNWELMAATGAQAGIDIMLVTKHLKPEWLHQAIKRGRARCGVQATYEPKTFRDVIAHLRKNGTVGLVLDQYAGPPVGIRVPFFGVYVGTNTVLATLAKRTGASVLPVLNHRDISDRCLVEIQPPVAWKSDPCAVRELAENTASYTAILEGHIRRYPEQWLWTHKRFKGDLSVLREGEWSEARPRTGPPR